MGGGTGSWEMEQELYEASGTWLVFKPCLTAVVPEKQLKPERNDDKNYYFIK